jgi:hypothetical protein
MKNLFRILVLSFSLFLVNPLGNYGQNLSVKQTSLVIVKGDTALVYQLDTTIKKPCKCDKVKRRTTKKTGEPRTQIGKVLFDIFDVFKKIIPFLH